jgi:thioredoxin-like negative regulator of GroEL
MLSVLYFTAPWCQPCKAYKPVAEKVFSERGDLLTFVDIDDGDPLTEQVVAMYAIQSVPTLIIEDDHRKTYRLIGAYPEKMLRERLDKIGKMPEPVG